MQSTLSVKPGDDPCDAVAIASDAVAVAPDAVRVAPSDDELSNLLHQAARHRSETEQRTAATHADLKHAALDFKPDSMIAPVDAAFRPASANDVRGSGERRSMAARVARAAIALLLGACISLAAIAWKSYGEAAKRTIAALTTQFVVTSSQPEPPALAAQPAAPAVQADTANAAPPQPAPPTQTAPNAVAPPANSSPDSAQLLQSMSHDLVALRQEVEELKAGMEQLRASQQQAVRDTAKDVAKDVAKADVAKADVTRASDQNLRPGISAPPQPRPVAPQTRKPMHSFSPPHAAAAPPMLAQPATPYYVPRQPEPQPQVMIDPADTELSSVPRPPMPVR